MDDIRDELSRWLREVQGRKAELDQLEAALQTTLDAQDAYFRGQLPLAHRPAVQPAADPNAIAEFIELQMSDGKPWSVDQLVESANVQGIQFGGKNPNRVVNITLVNMKGKVGKVGEKTWQQRIRLPHRSDNQETAPDPVNWGS
jgi:type II secretory pathway pseudopilin PulG